MNIPCYSENESVEKKGVLNLLKMALGLEQNKSLNLSPTKNGKSKGFSEED